jgi:hypothetical protein
VFEEEGKMGIRWGAAWTDVVSDNLKEGGRVYVCGDGGAMFKVSASPDNVSLFLRCVSIQNRPRGLTLSCG